MNFKINIFCLMVQGLIRWNDTLKKETGRNIHTISHSSKTNSRDFPGSPVVTTSPSDAGSVGLIPDRGAEILHALQPKNQKK